MRKLALAILAIASVSTAAGAQTYGGNSPVCLQVYYPIQYFDCSFASLPQCAASASGRAAQCVPNPFPARR